MTISTTTSGATIYYTTNGTNPTTSSQVYNSPIAISTDTTLRAMCTATGTTESTVAVASYVITPPSPTEVAQPQYNPPASTQNNDFLLSLTSQTDGATICFTLDGSNPTCASGVCQGSAQTYNSQTQVPVNGNVTNPSTGEVTVKAVACKAGNFTTLGVVSQQYTLQVATPALNGPPPGQYDYSNATLQPLLSTATTGTVNALYSTNPSSLPSCTSGLPVTGTLPTSWNVVESNGNQTFYFAACKPGYKGSEVYTAAYSFKLGKPTFTPVGGDFDKTQSVTVGNPNTGVANDWLCTTDDGTTPTCGATQSTCGGTGATGSPIGVLQTGTTLKSIVCGINKPFVTSDVADSGAYTLQLDPIKFTPANGTPVNAGTGNLAVTIGQDTAGGAGQNYSFICWSTNGTTPTCACPTSGTGLTKTTGNSVSVPAASVTADTTIKAIACDSGTSPVSGSNLLPSSASATYPSAANMAQPGIEPATTTQSDWIDVTFTNNDATRTARICYTTDGSDPTPTATCGGQGATSCTTSVTVGNDVTVNDLVKATNVTVKARACDIANPPVKAISTAASVTYSLKVAAPTLCVKDTGTPNCATSSPQPGSVPIGSTIDWRSATVKSAVTFYYTTDGSIPSCAGGGTTTVGTSYHMVDPAKTTIKVIGCSPQMAPSEVSSWTYSYFMQTPKLLPVSGTYDDYVQGTVENGPSDTISPTYTDFFCYTFTGADPTCTPTQCGFGSSQIACGPGGCGTFVNLSATLKVIACSNNGLPPSAVASASYSLQLSPLAWSPDPAGTYTTPQTVDVGLTSPPSDVGGGYTVCTATGAVSIPPQPNTCAGLGTYLNNNTPGVTWSCTTGLGTTPATSQSVSLGLVAKTQNVSAVACKENMVWSTSQKTYTFNPYSHTIIIDGANDFNATNEALTSGADVAYLSWDTNNIYLGYKGYSPLSGETVDVYFGDGAQGTTTGDPLGPLPVNALYHLMWKNTAGTTATVRKWTPGSPGSWGVDATVPVTVGWTGGSGYDYVEFSISRASIGNPTLLAMFGGLLDSTNSSYVEIWPAAGYYDVQLLASTVPNQSTIK